MDSERQTPGFEKVRRIEFGVAAAAAAAAVEAELAETAVHAFGDRHRSASASPLATLASSSSFSNL